MLLLLLLHDGSAALAHESRLPCLRAGVANCKCVTYGLAALPHDSRMPCLRAGIADCKCVTYGLVALPHDSRMPCLRAGIADCKCVPCSRQAVAEAAAAGRIEEAMAAAEALVPGALAAQPAVLFRLQCQQFLELVRGRDDWHARSQ